VDRILRILLAMDRIRHGKKYDTKCQAAGAPMIPGRNIHTIEGNTMTIEERKAQNKRCFERIKELENEMHEMETLIADNLVKIYEAEHPENGA